MLSSQSLFVLAIFDLIMILAIYVVMSLVFRFIYTEDDPEENLSKFWVSATRFIEKFHVIKIIYLIAALIFLHLDLKLVSETLVGSTSAYAKFMKLNLLFVANAVVVIFLIGPKIALFQKKTIEV